MSKIFDDFKFKEKTPISVIEKYKDNVPAQVVEVWRNFGFGGINDGYLRVVNPDDFQEVLNDTYNRNQRAIPLFTTAMGDILVWEDEYLLSLNYRKHEVNVVAKNFKFFFNDIFDDYYLNNALGWAPYPDAIKKYETPAFDECFGYVPLLGLGGTEKVENLKKVKLIEHIYLITEFMGQIE
ncbi:T6SS immunity protein Tdi1 domain-containing protein [Paenibacillus sp. GbtcB18]|uniref:T6SS immunity protein Tdi1 domain-containing protein n=1 Tax=Paenibacillus sp. GbtcB18 TaxID=2824763 RepID=UPI001C303421|nr:T6SS immunity protein Tdi1 domain-containing protein [Paenibacillus sp. GbtcB18]